MISNKVEEQQDNIRGTVIGRGLKSVKSLSRSVSQSSGRDQPSCQWKAKEAKKEQITDDERDEIVFQASAWKFLLHSKLTRCTVVNTQPHAAQQYIPSTW
eukprot:scaffold7413_cov177-Ochromonas_danica.AAC.3